MSGKRYPEEFKIEAVKLSPFIFTVVEWCSNRSKRSKTNEDSPTGQSGWQNGARPGAMFMVRKRSTGN